MVDLGPVTKMQMEDPLFASLLWKMTPASMAVRLSRGFFQTWNYTQLLSRKLVDVATGRCKRLIICCPPRHGKSELVSKWFPVWYLENFQRNRFILVSYEADFAAKFGGRARDILVENQELVSLRFSAKMPAQHFWETTVGGAMMCAGAGGPITGKGANVMVIDDPIKNSEEACSVVMQEKMWDWYSTTARTRLEPNGSLVIMATRWNQNDLIGRILEQEQKNIEKKAAGDTKIEIEGWEVFVFPALAEPDAERHYRQYKVKVNDLRLDALTQSRSISEILASEANPEWRDILGRKLGDALCPDRYTEKDLVTFKSTNLRDWYALYQQRPGDEAEDGNVYYAFDEHRNCKKLNYDERLQLAISVDFNVDPLCMVICQYDRGAGRRILERCEVLEELCIPNTNTPAAMERLLIELRKYRRGYTLKLDVFGDAAGTQRSPNSRKTNWQIVAEYLALDPSLHYRFLRRKANPPISDRINAVNTLLCSADNTVRLVVDDTKCHELLKDFKKVKFQTDSFGNPTGLLDKSDKSRTHVSDALGYLVEYLFGLRVPAGGRKGLLQ